MLGAYSSCVRVSACVYVRSCRGSPPSTQRSNGTRDCSCQLSFARPPPWEFPALRRRRAVSRLPACSTVRHVVGDYLCSWHKGLMEGCSVEAAPTPCNCFPALGGRMRLEIMAGVRLGATHATRCNVVTLLFKTCLSAASHVLCGSKGAQATRQQSPWHRLLELMFACVCACARCFMCVRVCMHERPRPCAVCGVSHLRVWV